MRPVVVECVRFVDTDNFVETKIKMVMNSSILVMLSSQPCAYRISDIARDDLNEVRRIVESVLYIFTDLWIGDYEVFGAAAESRHFKECVHVRWSKRERICNIISLPLAV